MWYKELLTPKPNLTKSQSIALRELKKDRDCIVLTADKGVAMVIMDRQDYLSKANTLLNQNTYRSIPWDPTNTIKNKLINILKRVKSQTGLGNHIYKAMYPTGCVLPGSEVFPRSTSWTLLLGLLCPAVDQSHMGWLRTCQSLKTLSWQVSPPHKQYLRLCGTGQTHHSSTRGMP